jgi:hypothetical protein
MAATAKAPDPQESYFRGSQDDGRTQTILSILCIDVR